MSFDFKFNERGITPTELVIYPLICGGESEKRAAYLITSVDCSGCRRARAFGAP